MAEGTSTSPGSTVCPFSYYSSDEHSTLPQRRTTTVVTPCRYFLQGRCLFGDKCWNSHTALGKRDATSAQSERCERHVSAGTSRQVAPAKEPPRQDKYEAKFCSLHQKADPHPPDWVNAPEFVPKTSSSKCSGDTLRSSEWELCSYYADGECPFGGECPYTHGEVCDICQKACLHPADERQRRLHTEQCERELEQDMELSFAVQRSRDKACGICMDVVLEKEPLSERRFGILEKCNHVFCLTCIRKWRRVKSFEESAYVERALDPGVTRGCPECRVASDFITPSQFWVDTEEEKGKLISDYKGALSKKACKYFKQGKGSCPFGGACFYLHARPDGTRVELPLPVRRPPRPLPTQEDARIFLWDYLEFREDSLLMQLELDDLVYSVSESGSDTSEASDNFFLSESF